MKKAIIILALIAATLTGYSQALPTGSVPFGQQTWIAPDGSIWVGKDGFGYKQVLYLNSSAAVQEVRASVQFVSPGALRVTTPTTDAMAANKGYVDNAISASLSDISISDVSGLQAALDGKADIAGDTFTGPIIAPSVTSVSAAVSQGTTLIGGANNSGGIVSVYGSETKFAGFLQTENKFTIGYGTTTPGLHTKKFDIDLPTGNAEFTGTVSGDDGVSDDDFVTVGQLNGGGGGSGSLASPKTFYVFDGMVNNSTDSTLSEVDIQGDGYWTNGTADNGGRIEFEYRGSIANSSGDKVLSLYLANDGSAHNRIWSKTILSGDIPAQELWINGVMTKIADNQVRLEIEVMFGDAGGMTLQTIETGTDGGSWDFSEGDVQLGLISTMANPQSIVLSHARFTRFPINGIYTTNF